MKIIDMPRGTGKTFQLAILSEKLNIPIVVWNDALTDILQRQYPQAHFLSYNKYKRMPDKPRKILVDEFPQILQDVFSSSEIVATTYSSEEYYAEEVKDYSSLLVNMG